MDLGFRGGFSFLGRYYQPNPIKVTWANDNNAAACRSYRLNLGTEIRQGNVWEHFHTLPSNTDILIGGFPCQDISINGRGPGVTGERSGLYTAMVQAIAATRPKVFVAENVKGLLMRHNLPSLEKVIGDFGDLDYTVDYALYQAANYGVPQIRERVFIIGTAPGTKPFDPPDPLYDEASWIDVKSVIHDLEGLSEDKDFNHVWSRAQKSPEQGSRRLDPSRPGHTIRAECHGNIQWHYALPRRISMREAARIQSFPDTYIFDAKLRETERQLGNAVPPVLAWHIAQSVLNSLDG